MPSVLAAFFWRRNLKMRAESPVVAAALPDAVTADADERTDEFLRD